MDHMNLLRMNWDTAIEYCEQLAEKIDFRPDTIVGISRGGLVPARVLSDVMGVKDVAIIDITFYKKAGETADKPEIVQEIARNLEGRKILLVDDVSDTGKSLATAKEYLQKKGVAEIRTATLHYKPHTIFMPDYYIGSTDAWIVYPWERHEVEREMKK